MSSVKKNISIIKELPSVFGGNSFSVNLFLFLFAVCFFIAGADLSSELAKDKGELNYVLNAFEESYNVPQISPEGLEDITRILETEIPDLSNYNYSSIFNNPYDNRGPPEA